MAYEGKHEKPTPRRRQKAREQGQVARSRDLINGVASMTVTLVLVSALPGFGAHWRRLFSGVLDQATSTDMGMAAGTLPWKILPMTGGIGLAVGLSWIFAVCVAVAQGGLVIAPSSLAPNFSRLNPVTRLQQLFSLAGVSRLLKSLLPVAMIVYFALSMLQRDWLTLVVLPTSSFAQFLPFFLGRLFEMTWKSGLVLLVWSGVDYFVERHRLEGELRMSRQELMDEYKETEGNPATKMRIRRLQRQVRRRQMLDNVKRAAVVITNPNEFAIALEYTPLMAAPTVIAKGRNLLAAEIKHAARWHGIPLIENPPLAHALYRAVPVGQAIPAKLYTAVAEILAAIYRAQSRAERTGKGGV
ncbi:MAG TPA: EscU/YscU/HrcU family type III secretion system export apparatus switch protein [Terriglobales bacterium]|nr:EscU/YscU/HrcU family type III secretion system export apparatus switch protein [Terriglobales bacterium]